MIVHAQVDVEGRHLQIRCGESKPAKRVDQREGLRRMLRIVVEAVGFVGEVESRSDDGDP